MAIVSGGNLSGDINRFDTSYIDEPVLMTPYTGAIYYSGDYAVVQKQYSQAVCRTDLTYCEINEYDAYILVHILGYWKRYW